MNLHVPFRVVVTAIDDGFPIVVDLHAPIVEDILLTKSRIHMRATPNKNDAFPVFFYDNSDVAKHTLSSPFLDTDSDFRSHRIDCNVICVSTKYQE